VAVLAKSAVWEKGDADLLGKQLGEMFMLDADVEKMRLAPQVTKTML